MKNILQKTYKDETEKILYNFNFVESERLKNSITYNHLFISKWQVIRNLDKKTRQDKSFIFARGGYHPQSIPIKTLDELIKILDKYNWEN